MSTDMTMNACNSVLVYMHGDKCCAMQADLDG